MTTTTALTVQEHAVALLAGQGLTNRAIAACQHVTVSTVEQHLTRVYRKLGGNRAGLRAMVATTGGIG